MKLKREARTLKLKALSSLRSGLTCFNSFVDDGRVTSALLHLQHASEMLLKALLIQGKVDIRNPKTGNTEGLERCIGLAKAQCGLTEDEAGIIRTIDSLRDAAQHWIVFVDEGLLFLYARALVTVIDDVLNRNFRDDLASHLPVRILPVSTNPLGDIDLLAIVNTSRSRSCLSRDDELGMKREAVSAPFLPWRPILPNIRARHRPCRDRHSRQKTDSRHFSSTSDSRHNNER
jgi:hypothetical protein